MLQSLLYISVVNTPMTRDDIKELVRKSQENNDRAGLTGFLMYNGINFLQLLEGESEPLETCWNKISNDQRHSGIKIMQREEVNRRMLGDWPMFYVGHGSNFSELRAKIEGPQEMSDNLQQIISGFVNISRNTLPLA